MIRTATIPPNVSVMDLVSQLYGDLDLVTRLLTDNPIITSVNMDLTPLIGQPVKYDDALSNFVPPSLHFLPPVTDPNIGVITALLGQSLYDICLMTYGTLDLLYQLILDNEIDGVNSLDIAQMAFNFDISKIKNAALFNFNQNHGIVYCTATTAPRRTPIPIAIGGPYLMQENDDYLLLEDGHFILL